MSEKTSSRIAQAISKLPLRPDMRVLEIGCRPGVAAREISRMLTTGRIVALDRSAKAIAQALAGSTEELSSGRLEFRPSSRRTGCLSLTPGSRSGGLI